MKRLNHLAALDTWPLQIYFYFLALSLVYGDWTGFVLDDQRSNLGTSLAIISLACLLCLGIYGLVCYLLRGSAYRELVHLVAPGLFIYQTYLLFSNLSSDGNLEDLEVLGLTLGVFFIQWALVWSLLGLKKGHGRAWISLGLSLAMQTCLVFFLLFPGVYSPGREDLTLGQGKIQAPKAKEVSYGKGLGTFNLAPYVSYNGWNKKIRDWYWGFSLSEVPIRGKAYLPKNKKAPVLFFVHGNHNMTSSSHLGYDYLGRYLAQRGVAMVSLDENFLNGYLGKGVGEENDARAILMLEHVKRLMEENRKPNSSFYQAFDEEAIFLGGHSRGGEAAHLAADFTRRDHYPDEATRKLTYPLKPLGLITLSPTYGQYNPAGHSSKLEDLYYLTLQGSNDTDVDSFMGEAGYRQVKNQDPTKYKMAIYAGFMDHAGSNDQWRSDKTLPEALFYNQKDLLSPGDQKALVAQAMGAFIQDALEARGDFYRDPQAYLPQGLYWIKKEGGQEEALVNFEEDSLISTNSYGGTSRVLGAYSYKEEALDHMGGSSPDVYHGLDLSFSHEASYLMTLPGLDLSRETYLRLDAMNLSDEESNVEVYLEDQAGQEVLLEPSPQSLNPCLSLALTKFYLLNQDLEDRSAFQSLIFPLNQAKLQAQGLDPSQVEKIKIVFKSPNNGHIIIDELGMGKGVENVHGINSTSPTSQ